jgi:hypothetical protein
MLSHSDSKALAHRYFDERWNKRNFEVMMNLLPMNSSLTD